MDLLITHILLLLLLLSRNLGQNGTLSGAGNTQKIKAAIKSLIGVGVECSRVPLNDLGNQPLIPDPKKDLSYI